MGNELKEEKKVELTTEDMDALKEMYSQFNIDMPEELTKAIEGFLANPNLQTEQLVKLYTLKAQAELEHPVLRNKMFEAPSENCRKIAAELQFEIDLINEIGVDEE